MKYELKNVSLGISKLSLVKWEEKCVEKEKIVIILPSGKTQLDLKISIWNRHFTEFQTLIPKTSGKCTTTSAKGHAISMFGKRMVSTSLQHIPHYINQNWFVFWSSFVTIMGRWESFFFFLTSKLANLQKFPSQLTWKATKDD